MQRGVGRRPWTAIGTAAAAALVLGATAHAAPGTGHGPDPETIEVLDDGSDGELPDDAVARVTGTGSLPDIEFADIDDRAVPQVPPASTTSNSSTDILLIVTLTAAVLAMIAGFGAALRGRRHDKLADIAYTDGLTGLRNRRRMDHDVAEQQEISARPTATMMIDVDHFKQFNDRYGHAMGDEVLRLVGATLSRHFRKTDVPYRYGGEEFCVLLPETSEAEAMFAGERIRAAVEAIDLPVDEHVTVSIGVSIGPASMISDTLSRADGALYAAKVAGRNRVALA